MRRQYHFRPSSDGYQAWDVDRLVEMTADFPVMEVPLGRIDELDEPYWYGRPEDVPTVRSVAEHARLIRDVSLEHPIILSARGRVMDGMHRVARAWIEGRRTIRAVRFETDPEPDFVDVQPEDLPHDDE